MSIHLLIVVFLFAAVTMLCCTLAEYVMVLRIMRDDKHGPMTSTGSSWRSDYLFYLSAVLCFGSLIALLLLD